MSDLLQKHPSTDDVADLYVNFIDDNEDDNEDDDVDCDVFWDCDQWVVVRSNFFSPEGNDHD